jgi:hypothetical protein
MAANLTGKSRLQIGQADVIAQRLDDLMPQARRGSPITGTERDALRKKFGLR